MAYSTRTAVAHADEARDALAGPRPESNVGAGVPDELSDAGVDSAPGADEGNTPQAAGSLVSAYLDDELDASGRARVEAWMAASPEARREVEQMRRVLSLVRGLPDVHAPEGFADRVERRFRRERAFGEGFAGTVLGVPLQVFAILVLLAIAAIQLSIAVDRDAKGVKVEDEVPRVNADDGREAPPSPEPTTSP
jgi:anti-sigma factor RsiW